MTFKEAKNFVRINLENITSSAEFEAEQLLSYVTGANRTEQFMKKNTALSVKEINKLKKLVKKRKRGIPLQYLLGSWEFYGHCFKVGRGVLIPRSDTELIVDLAVDYLKQRYVKTVFDFCAGSGAIGISVSKIFPTVNVIMVEKSRKAFKYLKENIEFSSENGDANIVAVRKDIFKFSPKQKCDLLISNPPYIKSEDMKSLSKEVKREPKMALNGGKDGLRFYKKICQRACEYLNVGGRLMFEIGFDEATAVTDIMKKSGFSNIQTVDDLCGNNRVVFGDLSYK